MLTVLSVAFPLAPVGPDAVGGAEQIIAALDAALVTAGHRSIVIACGGSRVAGELVDLPAPPIHITREAWIAMHAAWRVAIAEVLARDEVDIVHLHGIDFHAYVPRSGPPVLATLHMPLDMYPPEVFATPRPDLFLQCVSQAQRRTAPAGVELLDLIENGVDLERLRPSHERGDYAVVLGRICPEKGPHLALDAATRAGVPLVLAGKTFGFSEHEAYFDSEVEPRLVPPHRFVGPVAGLDKTKLLADARCLVVPSLVAETSSLVAMEALACGTPVIAFRCGALVDLLEHGSTGLLADDLDGLADGLRRAGELDRARCRAVAEARCSLPRMCEAYLARYAELAAMPPRHRTGLRVEIVDRAGLRELEEPWAALWSRAHDATVFQRPDWCIPWCDHLLRGEIAAIAVWRDGDLEGLVPLFRWRDGDATVLSLIGAGVSDYQDLLLAPGADDVLRAIERTLSALPWDRLELSELGDGSPLLSLAVPGHQEITEQEPCPALRLGRDAALGGVPRGARRDLEYQRRHATRACGMAYETLRAARAVDALTELHRARWSERDQAGAIDDARHAFLHDAAGRLAARDAVFGIGVLLGHELAATALMLVDGDTVRYYLGGFAPELERFSPGLLAIAGAIEESGRRGAALFDFLRGAESYKYRLGAVDRVRLHRRVVHRVA